MNPYSADNALTGKTETPKARPPTSIRRLAWGAVLLVLLALAAQTLYVVVYEPDPQETLVLGQRKLDAGSPAALRVLVRNRVSGKPVKGAAVVLKLQNETATHALGSFQTDAAGSLEYPIAIPDIPPGPYEFVLETRSALGRDRIVKKVAVQSPTRVFLACDKPVYQPGRTIHLRGQILHRRTRRPVAGETVTFEVKDSKGNKVFKETRSSSQFGIAAADFVLASEVNLGRYEISATAGSATAERTIEIKRYVLPKFKIQIATGKTYYLPGQTVTGSVQAKYFFGRALDGGKVKLTATTVHEQPVTITELQGPTDPNGLYRFEFVLPDFFAGKPQKNEQAFLDLKAEVSDTASHTEQATLSLPVSKQELELTVIPEAGQFVPGVENMLYVLTAYPDGRPTACRVTVNGKPYASDAQGIAEVRAEPGELTLNLQATDAIGKSAVLTHRLDPQKPPPFLLRTDKAVYQPGENVQVTVISPEKRNTLFLDVIQEGHTVLTKAIALDGHRASQELPLPASLAGPLMINAYTISATGEDRGCSRVIYVHPAASLRIATHLSKSVYRPGEVARLDFSVTDEAGRPTAAALGITVVDESVFALRENRPGLLQQLLEAEGDLLKPRYQIKSFERPGHFLTHDATNQALARAYLASLVRQSSEPGLEEMVQRGYLTEKTIEKVRSLQGSPHYEAFRKNPQFAQAIRLLEAEHGIYSLRENTGRVKPEAAKAYRKAYFDHLRRYAFLGFLGLVFLLPVYLLIYYSRLSTHVSQAVSGLSRWSHFAEVAAQTHNLLTVLGFLPMICYPLGLMLLERSQAGHSAWPLLAFETTAVLLICGRQLLRVSTLRLITEKSDRRYLRFVLVAYLTLFLLARGGFVLMVFHPRFLEGFALSWILIACFAPFFPLAIHGTHLRRQFAVRGISTKALHCTLGQALLITAMLVVFGALLLPALARANKKSPRVFLRSGLMQIDSAQRMAQAEGLAPGSGDSPTLRIRRDFPETLLWRPELITDDEGRARLEFPVADSITTWRGSVEGMSAAGKMGSAEVPITVFQDFFVDPDLPVSMTLGDQVSVPVTCYNYLREPQEISLGLAAANWFACPSPTQHLRLNPNEIKSVSFPLQVLRAGNQVLRVTARGKNIADAVERELRVLPAGERMDQVRNVVLRDQWRDTFTLPPTAIPDSQSLRVKFYPSRFTEIIEGLDSIFQAPYGCFEQTSSTTYPNVLVLDFMKRMRRITPELELKARKYINAGYQRLLTFEVPGGGFEWFGRPPANICLTAYGILEFTDMARVHPVDEAVIERARQWLFSRQNRDGSWDETNRERTWAGRGPITAYIAGALAEAGDASPNLERAFNYLQTHRRELANTYAQALVANALLARNRNDAWGRELAAQLNAAAHRNGEQALHWTSDGYSLTYSQGNGLDVETTALAALVLIKAGLWPETAKQALNWISSQKTPGGTWGSTQATIQAMRALLAGTTAAPGRDFNSTITVFVNGQDAETFSLNRENSDVMRQIELTGRLRPGENHIEIRQEPNGELPMQLAGVYWLPASSPEPLKANREPEATEPLQIDVHYDRATLPVNDQLTCRVDVRNNTRRVINMCIVDLGIPAGFDVDPGAFADLREQGRIAKFEMTGNQVILYLRELSSRTPFAFEYSLRAKYPLRVQTPASAVYEYYHPQNRARSKPLTLEAQAPGNP